MKKFLICLLAITTLLPCALSSCSKPEESLSDPEKYTSYICYDYHLKCLEPEGKAVKTEFSYRDDFTDIECTERAWIQKIANESDDMFIYARVLPSLLLGTSHKVVMQNPNNYVNVWTDWSVDKIELYYISLHKPITQDKSANIPTAVIATTAKGERILDIKNLVNNAPNEWEKYNIPKGYVRENVDENGREHVYYLRVHFKESENIVWESQVESFYSSTDNNRIIYIDAGKEPNGVASNNIRDMNLSNYPSLYSWISKAIDTLNQTK